MTGGADGTGRSRARLTGQQRREQLIGVARSAFAERGFEAASVEEIADRAKVSKPLVYHHFGGKEGMYAVVVDREVERLLGMITDALEASHPRQMLEQAATAFLTYIEEHGDGFRVLVRAAPSGHTDGATPKVGVGGLPGVMGDITVRVERLLARELRSRGYPRKSAPLYAHALVGMVSFVGQWWLEAGKPERGVVAAHLVNLAWNGLRDLDHKPTLGPPE